MRQLALQAEGLTAHYGKNVVLWDLSFEVPSGQLVAIVGPNGAGKSTLLKAALGIVKPVSGGIQFFGKPYKQVADRIAYVPQRESVDWDFPITALGVVLMGSYGRLGLFRRPGRRQKQKALAMLERVGMAAFAERQISQLSGGQQQRIFIARALMQEADLYLMDEPFAGVDVATEQVILDLLRQLKDEGKTVFVVHHDLQTVSQAFDWALLINMRLVACGPIAEVFTQEFLERTYGKGAALFGEAFKLSETKTSGLA